MIHFIVLFIGLAILTVGADLLVRGSVGLARRLHIPPLIIGLTIVAFGTSAPELVVSLEAALEGADGIAIGNVVGSNIANMLLVLGLPALIRTTMCDTDGTRRNYVIMMIVTVVFLAMCWDGEITHQDGFLLLVLLALFLAEQFTSARKARRNGYDSGSEEEVDGVPTGLVKAIIFTIIGLISLPIAADAVVSGATGIARMFDISETAIGVTLVALGTSLPELAAAIMAAYRGQSAVVIGNAIGSNIFNVLAIIGITSAVTPLTVPHDFFHFEIWAMLLASIFVIPFIFWRFPIGRVAGSVMVLAYAGLMYGALVGLDM